MSVKSENTSGASPRSNRIKLLPVHVANKIAAGEVVDRPASVVKELVENAIDSGASRVDVEIVAGGRKLVTVSDDGCGMSRDDALLSVERQATSKISDVDDIEHISTLGFRGEALAAIASVSRFRMTTCASGADAGTEISISAGKMQDVIDKGCPVGTSISVRDLFFNVPARRKFLRTHKTEMSHVRMTFIVQALGHPEVGMKLTVDGKVAYDLPAGGTIEDRVTDLFGAELVHHLRPVSMTERGVNVTGYVSLPAVNRSDKAEQYIFVNGRPTSAAILSYAVREGYHTLLPSKRHPSLFIFMEMDPGLVDVNVHPTKKEVRFRKPSDVRDTLIDAIRVALASDGGGVSTEIDIQDATQILPDEEMTLKIDNLPVTRAFKYPRGVFALTDDAREEKVENKDVVQNIEKDADAPWAWCRVLGQIGGLYVLLETEDGYMVMDPHAAHERVLFEKFTNDITSGKVDVQTLLIPETVDLGVKDAERVRKNIKIFQEMGFGISEFGGDTFVVDAMPSCFANVSAVSLIAEIAQELDRVGSGAGKARWQESSIAQSACKAAVKANDQLGIEEIEKLVVDLAGVEMPYTCPHGRPTMIYTSFRDLRKKFGRE